VVSRQLQNKAKSMLTTTLSQAPESTPALLAAVVASAPRATLSSALPVGAYSHSLSAESGWNYRIIVSRGWWILITT